MASGSLLGSPNVQVQLKASGALARVYCVDAGVSLIKTFVLKHWDDITGMKLDPISGHFFLYPEHQEHRYMLSNGVSVREDVFVRSRGPGENGELDPPLVYYVVEFTNESEEDQRIATYAFAELAKNVDDELEAGYDGELRAIVACSRDERKQARGFAASRKPASYEVSIDHAKAVTPTHPGELSNDTNVERGLATAIMQFTTPLERNAPRRLVFTLSLSANGQSAVRQALQSAPRPEKALEETQTHYHASLSRSIALTPNPEINRGCLWAKANMERVLLHPQSGWSMTNDPTDSSNSVGRDVAWFCAGADYFRTDFAADALMQFVRRQRENGMFVEYYDMLSDKTEDFGLNVNDDTPLIVWSLWHHYRMTGDEQFLNDVYESAVRAGRYLASQRNGNGLVWCTSTETGSKGIVSWRNVIKDYRLSGAVTELNSECYAAFNAVAALAAVRDDSETQREFTRLAEELKAAINEHLFNEKNGLYYLNIDVGGAPRSDITADLVFPVLFNVASGERAANVIRRLSDRDFWTIGGMRTLPHDAINYTPDGSSGCLGGVWNGMTFWYAKAAAEYIPDFAQEALTVGFANYARNPQRNNTVPGQFSEWLHGETLVNEGMLLSPWFPPRYLWAVFEGLAGMDVSGSKLRIRPNLPGDWHWCGLKNVPFRGKSLTWFAAHAPQLRIWSNLEADTEAPFEFFDEDISERVQASGDDALTAGFRRADGRIAAFITNTSDRTITTALRIRDLDGKFSGRRFDSLQRAWSDDCAISGAELSKGMTMTIEPKGFHLMELDVSE